MSCKSHETINENNEIIENEFSESSYLLAKDQLNSFNQQVFDRTIYSEIEMNNIIMNYLKSQNNVEYNFELPHYPMFEGTKFVFFESELVEYIKTGRVKTLKEINAETAKFIENL